MADHTDPLVRGNGPFVRLRVVLEMLALLMIVLVCGAMFLTIVRGVRPTAAAAATARPSRPDPPLPQEPVSLEGAQLKGSRSAKVVLVEFSDFQCPYCGRFARETLPTIDRTYVDSGRVLLAFREFPLETIHKLALNAATSAECAGEQGAFWKIHDSNFADQTGLETTALRAKAKAAGLNLTRWDTCMSGTASDRVKADEHTGALLGVTGTPTFFIGQVQPDGRVKLVKRLAGAIPAQQLAASLDEALAPAGSVLPIPR